MYSYLYKRIRTIKVRVIYNLEGNQSQSFLKVCQNKGFGWPDNSNHSQSILWTWKEGMMDGWSGVILMQMNKYLTKKTNGNLNLTLYCLLKNYSAVDIYIYL